VQRRNGAGQNARAVGVRSATGDEATRGIHEARIAAGDVGAGHARVTELASVSVRSERESMPAAVPRGDGTIGEPRRDAVTGRAGCRAGRVPRRRNTARRTAVSDGILHGLAVTTLHPVGEGPRRNAVAAHVGAGLVDRVERRPRQARVVGGAGRIEDETAGDLVADGAAVPIVLLVRASGQAPRIAVETVGVIGHEGLGAGDRRRSRRRRLFRRGSRIDTAGRQQEQCHESKRRKELHSNLPKACTSTTMVEAEHYIIFRPFCQ